MVNEFIKPREHDRYAQLTLSRAPLNIITIAMATEINAYLDALSTRKDLCALLIDADGPDFSAGVDIPEHRADTVEQMIREFHRMIRLLHGLPMPVIAAIHGGTYGGGMELAAFCDIVLAADDLKIGVPEITLGVYPPVAVAALSQIIGYHRAAELVLTGRIIDAAEAQAIGLVNHVYPSPQFRERTEQYMTQWARLSAFSLRTTRRALRRSSFSSFDDALRMSETAYLRELMTGSDPSEGLDAFMQKRRPQWRDQ